MTDTDDTRKHPENSNNVEVCDMNQEKLSKVGRPN